MKQYPVLLNIYDLSPLNKYLRIVGLGFYHSAVEVNGNEITFGGGEQPIGGSGISISDPLHKQGYTLLETRLVGYAQGMSEVDTVLRGIEADFMAGHYNMIKKNCNHFSEELCYRLLKKHIPSYVNRMANVANILGCSPGQNEYLSVDPRENI